MGSTDEGLQPAWVRDREGATCEDRDDAGERDGNTEDVDFGETLSGMRIWPGLVPVAREMYEEHEGAVDEETIAERVRRQYERYQWFRERIEQPRGFAQCAGVLQRPRREPGDWEQALVELTLSADVEARVFLETWEPPADEPVLEEFRKVCAAVARNRE